jgi:hypothetical protein
MRLTSDPRPAGYPIAIVLFLVASYCALAGSQWIGAALAGAGALLLALLAFARRAPARSPTATTTR